jgi:TatD DNase family protein
MGLADVHAHLTHPRIASRQEDFIARAVKAGVTTIISNGLGPRDNEAVLELSNRHEVVKPALGFYPVNTVLRELRVLTDDENPENDEECTAEGGITWLRNHIDRAFAVGEIGMDGHWIPESLWSTQEGVFSRLVELAVGANKPIIVHTRKREQRCFEVLRERNAERVVWHCFGGKLKLARRIASHGHYFSIPANARRSDIFSRMLEVLPRESILLETDCPYLSPNRGRDSEPSDVVETARYASELWEVSLSEVEKRLSNNYRRLFEDEP